MVVSTDGTNPNGSNRRLLTSMDDIIEFNERFWEITKGLPITTGSIVKVPETSYERYGIKITDKNRFELKKESEFFYRKDIDEHLKRELLRQAEELEEIKQKRETEGKMSWVVAEIVREMMHAHDDGSKVFDICEIGGGTSAQIAGELFMHQETRDLLSRVRFHLVDWSPESLLAAKTLLNEKYGVEVFKCETPDFENFIGFCGFGKFDFIVSVGRFHRKSTHDYLDHVRNALADDGALVSGDWHSALWHHPNNLFRLLVKMGVDETRLRMLTQLFGDLLDPTPSWDPKPGELQAVNDHFNYWLKVLSEVKTVGTAGRTRLYMLKANLTSREYAERLQKAGFETDEEKIRAAFPKAKLPNMPKRMQLDSDFAVVTAAIKKR